MSTKIYYAWRMSPKVFSETFLPGFRSHCLTKASNKINHLLNYIEEDRLDAIYKSKGWKEAGWTLERWKAEKGRFFRIREAFKDAYKASKSHERGWAFEIDCSLNVWFYKNKFYVIPYGEWDGFKVPKGVEEYGYWNNTDQPEGVTTRQWNARGKTWDKVCLDNWDAGRLVYQIIDAKERLGLVELAKTLLPEADVYSVCFNLEEK